jgi:hypothetical protein
MPDYIAIIVFVGGIAVFVASLFYAREHLRYRKAVRGIFGWTPDPHIKSGDTQLEDLVRLRRQLDEEISRREQQSFQPPSPGAGRRSAG